MRRTLAKWFLTACIALLAVLVVDPVTAAAAQEQQDGEAIGGTHTVREDDADVPVPGVEMRVFEGEDEVGSDVSADDGSWQVTVPGPGVFRVELDADTLPEGVALRNEDGDVLDNVGVDPGQRKTVRFLFGERQGTTTAGWERFVNLTAQGVKFGAVIALAAVGLSLIFGITGLVNFAHGELVAFGALVAWFFNAAAGGPRLHLVLATLLTLPLAALFGGALEIGVWRPLRRRQSGRIALLVVAIGMALFLRHLYLVIYGGNSKPYRDFTIQRAVDLGPVSLPPKDLAIIGIAAVVLVAFGLLLVRTRVGTAMRAVADNRDLAEASGINVERIILITWISGTALAALGGVLQGVTEAISWDMGFALLLLMFAAVILGGLGTAFGAMAGGLVIGIVAQVSTFWFSSEFKLVFAMGALIVVLLFRPQGIFGRAERIG